MDHAVLGVNCVQIFPLFNNGKFLLSLKINVIFTHIIFEKINLPVSSIKGPHNPIKTQKRRGCRRSSTMKWRSFPPHLGWHWWWYWRCLWAPEIGWQAKPFAQERPQEGSENLSNSLSQRVLRGGSRYKGTCKIRKWIWTFKLQEQIKFLLGYVSGQSHFKPCGWVIPRISVSEYRIWLSQRLNVNLQRVQKSTH